MISIAVCTFNGVKYIAAQLDSFVNQELKFDELIISDDLSRDKTAIIVQDFLLSTPYISYSVSVSIKNCGITKNFEKAISHCSGDIIYLSDQDDVWHPQKIAKMQAIFERFPEVGAVFTDAEVVDENLQPLSYRLWQSAGFTPALQQQMKNGGAVDVLLKKNIVTGATLAFRANLKELILPIPACAHHDAWIALIAAFTSQITFIPEPLIYYRQHATNQIGGRQENLLQTVRHRQQNPQIHAHLLEQFIQLQERLKQKAKDCLSPLAMEKLEAKIQHLQTRTQLPESRLQRLPFILSELNQGRYHLYASGFLSALRDFWL